jgi:phosphopantetheinyl transferase (holo-ACP synthase)
MSNCTQEELSFPSFDRRKIEATFAARAADRSAGSCRVLLTLSHTENYAVAHAIAVADSA